MIVDCGDCKVRDIACADCVVTVLLGEPGWAVGGAAEPASEYSKIALDQEELGAMDVLAQGGLVPRLRLVVDDRSSAVTDPLSSRDSDARRRAI